jgi:hypothetical protein
MDRTQKCQVNGTISLERSIKCDVPQGSILGPFFLLYIILFYFILQILPFNTNYYTKLVIQ